ncbi:MAG: twitching motility protein [Desulfobulbaceae bacterium]|nr:twitching motility protein [Desulfobulbaceae bacterium]
MAKIILEDQQAALLLGATEDGIQVDMAYEGQVGLAAGLCEVIARRLVEDEDFRQELLDQVQKNAAGDY